MSSSKDIVGEKKESYQTTPLRNIVTITNISVAHEKEHSNKHKTGHCHERTFIEAECVKISAELI